jgi:O-antigen/teichoic acid export membrane protein
LSADVAKKPKLYSLRKLALGSTTRVIQLVILTVSGFALTPYTVHKLGSEQYGLWALASTFVGFYSLLDLGLSGAVFTRMSHALGARDSETATRIYATGLRLFSSLGGILIIGTILAAMGILLLHRGSGVTLSAAILILGLQVSISFPMRAPYGVLNAGGHFEVTSLAGIVSAILRAVGTVVVLRAGQGVVGLAIVFLLSWVPSYIFVCLAVHWRYPFIRARALTKWHGDTAKGLFSFGVPVLIGQIADRIRLQSDALVVSLFLGLSAVAHYNVASTLVLYYMDGICAIIGVLTPVLAMQTSAKDPEGMRRSLFVGTRLGLSSAAFVAFGLIAWGRAFISRWMGPAFLDAYPVMVILAVAMFFDLVQSTTVNALYATFHQKTYAKINICEAVANFVLSLVLAPHYGMQGIAFGTLIPAVARMFIQPFVVRHKLNIGVAEYFGALLRTSSKTAIFLIVPMIATVLWLRPTYPAMFLVGGISFVAFVLPMWYFEFDGIGWQRVARIVRPRNARLRSQSKRDLQISES